MVGLNDIVTINITTQTAPTQSPGFGLVVIVGSCSWWTSTARILFFTSLAGLVDAGCATTDPEYLAAQAFMSQNPQPTRFAIARRVNKPTMKFRLTPVALNARDYIVHLNGSTATYTSDGTATVPEIVAGLKTAIDALSKPVTTALVGTSGSETAIDVTSTTAGAWVRASIDDPSRLSIEQTHADPGLAADLVAIMQENGTPYGIMLTTSSKAEATALAAWVESNKKFCLQASQETAIVGTAASGATDAAATLKTSSYARTGLIYHPDNGVFADAAWFGATFPYSPGKIDFKFRKLVGVPSVNLNATQIQNATDKNCNFYTTYGDDPITSSGVSAAGEFVDLVRDRDALAATLQARIYRLRSQTPRLPYTDNGITRIKGEALAVGKEFEETENEPNFLVAGSFRVNFPRASTIAPSTKATRILTGTFTCEAAGSIYGVVFNGTITL